MCCMSDVQLASQMMLSAWFRLEKCSIPCLVSCFMLISALSYSSLIHYSVIASSSSSIDGAGVEVGTITLEVVEPNTPPIAYDKSVKTKEDTPLTIELEGSDSDGDPITFSIEGGGPSDGDLGEITYEGPYTASVVYTPEEDFSGDDSFTFEISDKSNTDMAVVDITVLEGNDAPVAVAGPDLEVAEGHQVVLSGEKSYDPDGDPLQYEWRLVNPSDKQIILLNQDPEEPRAPFTAPGVDNAIELTFELQVSDVYGYTDSDDVKVMVYQEFFPDHDTRVHKINRDLGGEIIPGQHMISFSQPASTALIMQTEALVKRLGADILYQDSFGFAFKAPSQRTADVILQELIKSIPGLIEEPDKIMVPLLEEVPTGVQRVDSSPLYNIFSENGIGENNVDADIAIIDSGIDLDHPDLNVFRNISSIIPQQVVTMESATDNSILAGDIDSAKVGMQIGKNTSNIYPPFSLINSTGYVNQYGDDKCGHGTHIAGIAAAKDDSSGIVGMAPGARLWSIKVLELDPYTEKCVGAMSSVVAALNYVTENSDQIDVVNLSLGCKCNSTILDQAILRTARANVTVVVAAGNVNEDAASFSPAKNENVITVSAITDRDGKCGGLGPITWIDDVSGFAHDDTFAPFSNFGSVVDIAAPGVNINSTYINGTYALMSGTSVAAPHVTGAAALHKAANPSASPFEIRQVLLETGSKLPTTCDGNGHGYYSGDADGYSEPLLYARDIEIPSTG